MTATTVADLCDHINTVLQHHNFGTLEVHGTLSGWRTHRSGRGTAELTTGNPPRARIRAFANRHATHSITSLLHEAEYDPAKPLEVAIHAHLAFDSRWGLQLQILRLQIADDMTPHADGASRANRRIAWPPAINLVGLITPDGGDDARSDVLAHLANTPITIVECRVPVTGQRAARAIAQALDRLAFDPHTQITLLVRGGGPMSDFSCYDSPLVLAAIERHTKPVVAGLGHATTITAADAAAHTSCITPTAAAQRIRSAI